ncbi:hypothetical protein GCM10009733_039610 [Nonomuraea maheshkhaliensis]|uniref:SH3 domain-containing protein n=1 Tax=Nonomuraea maheshkhaliensis TaxID=419590 RepID=A0ABN2FB56_9ACTN
MEGTAGRVLVPGTTVSRLAGEGGGEQARRRQAVPLGDGECGYVRRDLVR